MNEELMEETRELMDYYVAIDDGDHQDIVSNNDNIFEALCSYYQTIKEGSNDGVSTTRWTEVEIGKIIDEEQEPLDYHSFAEDDD